MKKLLLTALCAAFISPASFAVSDMEVNFNFGPSITQTGNIQDLGDPNFGTGFGFDYFLKQNHGIGLSFFSEYDFEGSKKFPGINDASISTFDIHYTYRHVFNDLFQIVFSPGFGWQTLYDETNEYWYYDSFDDLSTSLILNYKIFARFNFKTWGQDYGNEKNFFGGVGFQQNYSLDDTYKGKDITGSRVSMLFQLGLGF